MDARYLRRFALEDDPDQGKGPRGRLVSAVSKSSFSIEYVAQPDDRKFGQSLVRADRFGLFLKPQTRAKALFGLDREVLLWCSTYPSFQARDIEALRAEIESHGTRLSRQFAILVTLYEPETRSALESEAQLDVSLIHLSLEEVSRDGLEACLSRHLYARDLFDVAGAVVKSADFFGRRELLDALIGEIETGSGQIGLFGLRKVGKTSVLNRLADRLGGSGKCVVARLDLQWTTSINPSPEYTLWSLGGALLAAHRSLRAIQGYRLFGVYPVYSEVPQPELVWEDFAHDLQLILNGSRRRLCILVDEIERMVELTGGPGFVRFWRLLRGLDQQFPGRLRYVIGGTSPQCAEIGTIEGLDNPLFKYLRLEYLGPLSARDAQALLTELGNMMGLKFTPDALAESVVESGGHPALVRTLGSVIHAANADRNGPLTVSGGSIRDISPVLIGSASATLDQMISALEDSYPDEYFLLNLLVEAQIHEFFDYADAFPSALEHLIQYGLIEGGRSTQLRVRMLHTHLQRRRFGQSMGRVRDRPGRMEPGERVGPFKIMAALSSGGSCDVYEAENGDGQHFALKVFRNGQLSSLQREVEILAQLRHAQIVRVIDALRTPSGQPCMIMELIVGRVASQFCNLSEAPTRPVLLKWSRQLLEALEFMHPKTEVVKRLESQERLSGSEFQVWDQAKHGYIHRDIKPENIIITVDRGPVLIDFNISSRAGVPVHTVSATPGYLDGIPSHWTPAVDLYALGVTLAELGAGSRLHEGVAIQDLLQVAANRVGADYVAFLEGCLNAESSGASAGQLKSAVLRLPIAGGPRR